jgi:hypothetical protein
MATLPVRQQEAAASGRAEVRGFSVVWAGSVAGWMLLRTAFVRSELVTGCSLNYAPLLCPAIAFVVLVRLRRALTQPVDLISHWQLAPSSSLTGADAHSEQHHLCPVGELACFLRAAGCLWAWCSLLE